MYDFSLAGSHLQLCVVPSSFLLFLGVGGERREFAVESPLFLIDKEAEEDFPGP